MPPIQLYFFIVSAIIITNNIIQAKHNQERMQALRTNIACRCGKVKLAVDSPSALNLVCYCRDCRGYYNTLNALAKKMNLPAAAELDPFGGVGWTQVYPCEIKVNDGEDLLETCKIREGSLQHRVYSKCCYTPMFTIGKGMGSAMLNSALIPEKDQHNDIMYRIIGRQALKGDGSVEKPKMSFSVPFSWFFTMPRRVKKERSTPSPIDVEKEVNILEGFMEG